MDRRAALVLTLASIATLPAFGQTAAPPEVIAELPGARLQGQGRLRFFGLHVYDIRLWVTDGFSAEASAERPLALDIDYARALHGHAIAERSLDEMRRLGAIPAAQAERWLGAMRQLFVDVVKGDRLTGIQRPGEAARFFHNGELRGEVREAAFARAFFGIWLAPQTSEPKLRQALLGRTA